LPVQQAIAALGLLQRIRRDSFNQAFPLRAGDGIALISNDHLAGEVQRW
jgi:hypothetical protein